MVFAPCLWNAPKRPERVKQVWFEGAHSDVGGGYPKTGLSDTTLLWMVSEASRQGLVFDKPLLDTYVNSRSEAERHNSLTWFYKRLQPARADAAATGERAGAVHRHPPQPRLPGLWRHGRVVRSWALCR